MAKERDLADPAERLGYWNEQARRLLVGRLIRQARYVPDAEWGFALKVTMDDGTSFVVSGDDEGNHAGALHFPDNDRFLPQMQ